MLPDSKVRKSRRGMLMFQFSRLLYDNAALAQQRKLHPDIENEVIVKPIFILGINRTGTTFLHRLLARDLRFWTLRTYELIESVFPSDEDPSVTWTANDPRRQIAKEFHRCFKTARSHVGDSSYRSGRTRRGH